jgi:hypothetical protein
MEERLSRIESKVDALDGKVDALDRKVDALDRKIDETAARLEGKIDLTAARLDRKIDLTAARLDSKIDVQIESVRDDIRQVAEGLITLGQRMDRRFDELIERMAADRRMFMGILGNHQGRIASLEQRADGR